MTAIKNWHLFILASFAFVQPILDLLTKNPQFFVMRHSEPIDLFALLIILLLLPGSILVLLQISIALISRKLAELAYVLEFAALLICIALPISKHCYNLSAANHILISVLISVIFSILYFRTQTLKSYISFLSPVFVIFPLLFVMNKSISPLLVDPEIRLKVLSDSKNKADIVMLVFDELPLSALLNQNMEIDKDRFPGFAELAQNSSWFRNATTVSPWTGQALPVILSGRNPKYTKELPAYQDHPINIFTLLSTSHRLNVYEQVTQLCPKNLCSRNTDSFSKRIFSLVTDIGVIYLHIILPDQFRSELPDISYSWSNFLNLKTEKNEYRANNKGLLDKSEWSNDHILFEKFTSSIHKDSKPALNFLHITFPHFPYRYYPSGRKYMKTLENSNKIGFMSKWGQQEWPSIQHYQRFILQLGEADRMLAQLIKRLKDLDLYNSSLFVVVADHGVSFMPLEYSRRISQNNYVDIMSIPFFLKAPGQEKAEIIDNNVESTDVLSAIIDVLSAQNWQAPLYLNSLPKKNKKVFFDLKDNSIDILSFPAQFDLSASVQRKYKIFGSSNAQNWQFKIGSHQELLTKPIEQVHTVYNPKVKIDWFKNFENVNTTSDYLPGRISGTLSNIPVPSKPYQLAVAVNGIIQSITETVLSNKGELKFLAMVPENSFINGKNKIEVKIISK